MLKFVVFSGMRSHFADQHSVVQSVVLSCELMMSITVTYPLLHEARFTDFQLFKLNCPPMQLNIPREPGIIVQ